MARAQAVEIRGLVRPQHNGFVIKHDRRRESIAMFWLPLLKVREP